MKRQPSEWEKIIATVVAALSVISSGTWMISTLELLTLVGSPLVGGRKGIDIEYWRLKEMVNSWRLLEEVFERM